jgi:hypothetical protein
MYWGMTRKHTNNLISLSEAKRIVFPSHLLFASSFLYNESARHIGVNKHKTVKPTGSATCNISERVKVYPDPSVSQLGSQQGRNASSFPSSNINGIMDCWLLSSTHETRDERIGGCNKLHTFPHKQRGVNPLMGRQTPTDVASR